MSREKEFIHDEIGMSNEDYLNVIKNHSEISELFDSMNELVENITTKKECRKAIDKLEGEHFSCSYQLMMSRIKGNNLYSKHLGLIKVGLKNSPNLIPNNGNNIKRKLNLPEWISETKEFYHTALNNHTILSTFERYSITKVELMNGYTLIKEIEAINTHLSKIDSCLKQLSKRKKMIAQADKVNITA